MYSLFTSLFFNRKNLLFSLFFLNVCASSMFFYSSMGKWKIIKRYTVNVPELSSKDIVVLRGKRENVLAPHAFLLTQKEKIMAHSDVANIASLCLDEGAFLSGNEDPSLYIISLKEKSFVDKWINTFQARSGHQAVRSSVYKKMYRNAILSRNKAVYDHYNLLKYLSMCSIAAIIMLAAMIPIAFRNELKVLISEGMQIFKVFSWFSFLSAVMAIKWFSFIYLVLGFYTNMYFMASRLCMHTIALAIMSILCCMSLVLLYGWRVCGKNRVQ